MKVYNKYKGGRMGKLKITQISYKRIHNLGNYENQKVSCTTSVDSSENPEEVFVNLKAFVERMLFEGVEKLPVGRKSK